MPEAPSQQATPDLAVWSPFRRHLTAVVLVIGVALFAAFLLTAGQTLFLGFLIAFLLYRPIRRIARALRFQGAVALTHFLLLVVLALFVVAVLGFLSDSASGLMQSLQAQIGTSALSGALQNLQGPASAAVQALTRIVGSLVGLVGVSFLAIIVSFWLLNDLRSGEGVLRRALGGEETRQITILLNRLDQVWTGYLTAEVIFGLVMLVASFIEFYLLGVPYFGLMAVLTGFLTLIPSIGGLISSVVVAVPCLVLGSTRFTEMDPVAFTVIVWLINVLTTQIAYNFIAVPIVGRFVRLPSVLVLLAVLIAVGTGSFILAFLIVPILSSLKIAAAFGMAKANGTDPYPGEAPPEGPGRGLFSMLVATKTGDPAPPAT
jgi:predicted PurR-regulated permease PerM